MLATDVQDQRAIGMFDSGIGGLTVFKKIAEKLPHENLIYFGDTARLPYGSKSSETILRYSMENTIFLMEHQIKMLVISCNTASTHSADKLKSLFDIPIIDVIEPGVEKVVQTTKNQQIAVLGTKGTIGSDIYRTKILEKLPKATVTSIACPLFVHLVEENFVNHQATKLIIKEYLAPLRGKKIDTLLLGCTHYPLLAHLIQEEVGADTIVVDSASCCAEKVAIELRRYDLDEPSRENGIHRFYVSDDPMKFKQFAEEYLECSQIHVEKATSEMLAEVR